LSENGADLAIGDWVVHLYHGVGQIKKIEKKRLNGNAQDYYRVKTHNSVFWVPVSNLNNDRIRPLTSPNELKKALKILQKPPQEMDTNHNKRKSRINTVKSDGSLQSALRLVRDLSAREAEKKLNTTEKRALERLKDHMLREWATCMHIDIEEASIRLNNLLNQCINAA
jgi:CarD family transcriptional regulator